MPIFILVRTSTPPKIRLCQRNTKLWPRARLAIGTEAVKTCESSTDPPTASCRDPGEDHPELASQCSSITPGHYCDFNRDESHERHAEIHAAHDCRKQPRLTGWRNGFPPGFGLASDNKMERISRLCLCGQRRIAVMSDVPRL